VPRLIGFTADRALGLFPNPGSTCFDLPSARFQLRIRAHPSVMSPLQSSFAHYPRPVLSDWASPAWVSVPLRDITRAHLLFARTSQVLTTFRPRAFAAPRRFTPRTRSRVYCTPQPRPGSHCSGASLPARPPFLVGRSLPPCRCCIAASTLASAFAETSACPRTMPLGFEALIRAGPRSTSPVIHLARSRSPRQFRLLQVPLSRCCAGLPNASAHGVREPRLYSPRLPCGIRPLHSPSPVHLQRVVIESLRLISSPTQPTCSSFRTFHPRLRLPENSRW